MREIFTVLVAILPLVLFFIMIRAVFRWIRHPKRLIAEKNGMKKISSNPSIFGGSLYKEHYYYDDQYLYKIKDDMTEKIMLSEIINIKPGFTKVNNRRKWSVTYLRNGSEKEVHFFHNLTLFNHNFSGFLAAVKHANPAAQVKEISFLNV